MSVLLIEFFPLAAKLIRHAFDKQHAKDELLILGRIHLGTKNICRIKKKALKLGKGDFFLLHGDSNCNSIYLPFANGGKSLSQLFQYWLAARGASLILRLTHSDNH
jgi:hypothetical protein